MKSSMLHVSAPFAERLETQIGADIERAQREPLPADMLQYTIQSLAINDPLGPPRLSSSLQVPDVIATPYGMAASRIQLAHVW